MVKDNQLLQEMGNCLPNHNHNPEIIPNDVDGRVHCYCGSVITVNYYNKHLTTQKHRRAMERLEGGVEVVQEPVYPIIRPEHHSIPAMPRHLIKLVLDAEMEANHEVLCPICVEDLTIENTFMTHCGHILCKNCQTILSQEPSYSCPICRSQ